LEFAIKTPPVGGENALSECDEVESGGEMKAGLGVNDGMELMLALE
jgi:hypothetical protein